MSASAVPNALVRLLEERPDNWRMLADLAIDFAPPHVARAAGDAMSDPSTDPTAVLEAIRSAAALTVDDTPLHIGSIEPETLDFAPVSTIADDAYEPPSEVDLDFGAGTHLTTDLLDHERSSYELDDLGGETPSTELDHVLIPDRIEPLADEPVLGVEAESEDDERDDGDHLDVGD